MGLASSQLKALLRRHWLAKKRSPVSSAVEVLSPALLIGVLVVAYALVRPDRFAEHIYVADTSAQLASLVNDGAGAAFVDTHGPIPIPTLDEFILLHKVVRAALHLHPDMLDMIEGARRAFGWNVLGNLVDMGALAFAPASESVLRFTDHMMRTHALFKGAFIGVFPSEAEAETYALSSGRRMWALVVFNEGPSAAGADYTIRMNYTTVPRTWEKVNIWTHRIPVHYKEYYTSGFLSLQAAIDAYSLGGGDKNPKDPGLADVTAWTQWGAVMPTSAYTHNAFYDVVGSGVLGLLLCLALVYPASCLVRGMAEEKETRMRETLKIMGLHDWVAPAAWAITYGAIFLVACLAVTIVCKASFLRTTSATLLFALLAAFAAAQLAFAALLAAPLSNAKVAGVLAPAANFACLLPRYAFFRTSAAQAVGAKVAASLLAPSAFSFVADLIGAAEGAGAGLRWRDLWAGPYPVGAALCMMLGDAVLYSALAWYLERVLPASTGAPLPWWFPASAAYWRHGDPEQAPAAARLSGLWKVYGEKVAVRDLSLELHQGEILALLGHNGAGKTSAVGMLTGLIRPSAGECAVMGHSLRTQPHAARAHIGYCPQSNVLFDALTPREHLELFGAVKGISSSKERGEAATAMLRAVGLEEKAECAAATLSGGSKRKLQVGIALLADSSVVLLDEPSSGVDPASRQALWAILLASKAQRALLLTTHFLDEADALADRVAILREGRLAAAGPALALKARYCDGMTLTVTTSLEGAATDVPALERLVARHVAGARRLRWSGAELVYQLPSGPGGGGAVADLLDALEADAPVLGVGHFAVSGPTLEEAAGNSASGERTRQDWGLDAARVEEQGSGVFGKVLRRRRRRRLRWWVAFREMVRKRAITAGRDARGALLTLLLPVVAVVAVLSVLKVNIDPTAPQLLLQLPVATSGAALDSWQLSKALLGEVYAGGPAHYGAVVFDDPTLAAFGNASALDASQLLTLLPLLAAAAPGGAAGGGNVEGTLGALVGNLGSGLTRGLAWLSSPEARVASGFIARLQTYPPVMLLHNASSFHALPALMSGLHETLGAVAFHGNASRPRFAARSHPLPLTAAETVAKDSVLQVLAGLFVLVPFCYLAGAFAVAPVVERRSQAAHIQLLSGCPAPLYWAGSYAWDFATYVIIVLLTLAVFAAYGDSAAIGTAAQALGTAALLLAYGAAAIPMAYALSFGGFQSASSAQVAIAALAFVVGFVAAVGSYVMQMMPQTRAAQRVLVHFFRVAPPFLLGEGLLELTKYNYFSGMAGARQLAATIQTAAVPTSDAGVWAWDTIGRPVALLVLEAAAFSALTLALDWDSRHHAMQRRLAVARRAGRRLCRALARRLPNVEAEDEDVVAERARVLGGGAAGDAIALRHLRKVFPGPPPKVAVADLCLGIRAGERFGLLGDNGAGKTTTLQMLVGRVQPSGGGAVVRGGRSRLGFCPQQDALLELLTGAEQLALYALLKGVPEKAVAGQVADVLKRVSLPLEMSARPAHTYSGGSKRKLSLAIALIGDADSLLLDEPSSGMDPGARRAMWSYIVAATSPGEGPAGVLRGVDGAATPSGSGSGSTAGPGAGGVAVVLTTHSMEECEALCARVGIMHQGRLRCLGSPSRLKARYGGALALEVQAGAGEAAQAALAAWAAAELGAVLQSQHLGRARFSLPAGEGRSPARVLRALEAAGPALGITAYGLSLPTLEQVFISVIGRQLQH
ncbi:hypothetical protein WJX81_001382 [Elliptochloris bilobata]|uniref:ABC transporter domain-containing protein n=1 Tax=Elliptochloris bilobata TaxID=381761 RepID=A0AAW1RI29_9CHLO